MRTAPAIILAATCLGWALGAPVEQAATPESLAGEEYRLVTPILPHSYNITLRPYLLESDSNKQFTFDGEVYIEIQSNVNTKEIKMHSKNLKFTSRQYWKAAEPNTKKSLADVQPDSSTDIITYNLGQDELAANQSYILHFQYTGQMDDDMHGFYRSSYTDASNVTKWLGSTQFQTNHARRAFPCFDEPKFKAIFNVTLVRHKSMQTVSSSELVSSVVVGDHVWDQFAPTPKMSTYILAFIVSDFVERTNGKFSVVAKPDSYKQTAYSHTVGQQILSVLDEYLGIPYYDMGVDKMHMAAIPDFSAGAMENWGLLTFRERALLYEEGSTTLSSKQYIAAVVAHEQAHMWFGDLVTCDWWSYTWLNEGFARYFQYFATAQVETGMQLEDQFVVDQVQSVMSMDSTQATNPMTDLNTFTPADLSRMFNSISYNKGASFIRMVKHVLGEEAFQKSLQEYLNANKYRNTVPADLFTVWKKYFPNDLKDSADGFFTSYTEQVGYPVVTFSRTDNTTVVISQKRFLLNPKDTVDTNLSYTVPITYTTDVEKNFANASARFFLEKDSRTVQIGANVAWFIGNINETGYYRVNYDFNSWHAIHAALKTANWGGIQPINRAQLVDDLLNLARAGVIEYQLMLDILEYLATESHYLPWTAAFNGYSYLAIRLGVDTLKFGQYIRDLTDHAYKNLGFEEKSTDSTLDIYNRAKVLAWSCKYGNSECIAEAMRYFAHMDSNPVPVNIRSVVYCTAMRDGSASDYTRLRQKFLAETVATEETLLLNSLGCVKDKTLVEDQFTFILSDSVRRQDKSSALTSLYTENNENVEVVFDLITLHLDNLQAALGGYPACASLISNVASRFTTKEQQKKLSAFNAGNKDKFGSAYATLEAAEKTVEANLQWAEEKLGTFKTYLDKRGNGSASVGGFTVLTLVLVAAVLRFVQ